MVSCIAWRSRSPPFTNLYLCVRSAGFPGFRIPFFITRIPTETLAQPHTGAISLLELWPTKRVPGSLILSERFGNSPYSSLLLFDALAPMYIKLNPEPSL